MLNIFSIFILLAAATVFAGAAWLGFSSLALFLDHPVPLLANVVLPSCLAVGAVACLRLRRDLRLSVALCLFATVPAFYVAEWMIERQVDARRASRADYDPRSKIEVIKDYRAKSVDAYPVMRAKTLLVDDGENKLVSILGEKPPNLPLASLPDKTVVSCNESGKWLVYRSDRHGFHNPEGAWQAIPPAIMLVGDSFAHGSCVASDKNMAAYLRRRFGSVINLGVSGFGPLSMLAAIKEYGEPTKPRTVVWAFFEGNDLNEDLPLERRSPLLRKYLEEKDFSQGLYLRRDEWSTKLKAYLDTRLEEAMDRFDNPYEGLINFLQLFHLRERFGLGRLSLGVVPSDLDDQIAYFGLVLKRAKELVQSWGGQLMFAYLPESARYFAPSDDKEIRRHLHDSTLALARGLGLPIVDITKDFGAAPDAAALYVYPGSHFSEEGYRVAGKAIAAVYASIHRAR